jgi:hypothetical protein
MTPEEVLSRFDEEPTVLEVQEVATAYAHISQDTMDGWSTRANLQALMPRVRVRTRWQTFDDVQDDFDQSFEADADGNLVLADVDQDNRIEDDEDFRLELWGDWDLRELVFNPDLLRVSNEVSDLVELREDILTTVTSLYYERRRSQAQLILDPPADPVERLRRELEIQELTAGIDALTGGWFSAELSRRGLPAY